MKSKIDNPISRKNQDQKKLQNLDYGRCSNIKSYVNLHSAIRSLAAVLVFLFIIIDFASCNKKEDQQPVPVISKDSAMALDKITLANEVKEILKDTPAVVEPGSFRSDSAIGVVAGTEISTPKQWGIKFTYFTNNNKSLVKTFETPLLKGSFKESTIKKIKLSGINFEMIYYDSQDYFLGSGGGEIFSYIIDFNNDQVYSAHFFTVPKKPVSLYLSPNIENAEIRDMFVNHFQKDYPDLKIVSKDYNLEDIF